MRAVLLLLRRDITRDRVLTGAVLVLTFLLVTVLGTALGGALGNTRDYDAISERRDVPDVVIAFASGQYRDDDADELDAMSETGSVEVVRAVQGRASAGGYESAVLVVPEGAVSEIRLDGGELGDAPGTTALPRKVASALDVAIGDSIQVSTTTGTTTLLVSAFTDDPVLGSPIMGLARAVVSTETFADLGGTPNDRSELATLVNVRTTHGQLSEARAVIDSFSGTSRATFAYTDDFVRRAFTMVPGIVSALLALVTVTLAFVLVLVLRQTTLVLVHRERRTSGLLAAVGFTPQQARARLVARLVLFGATGALLGALLALWLGPRLTAAYLRSNGLVSRGAPLLWPALVAALASLVLICVVALSATRSLRRSRPRDAVAAGGGQRPGASRAGLNRRLAVRAPRVALAVLSLRREPSRYATLSAAVASFSLLSLSLLALSSVFASQQQVSLALGLNTYDVTLSRTDQGRGTQEDWLTEVLERAFSQDTVAFSTSMQQVNVGTSVGTVVATVSGTVPDKQEIGQGRAPAAADEVMLAAGLADELSIDVGSGLEIGTSDGGRQVLTVTGIYQTVNQTGLTLWMTSDAYLALEPTFSPQTFVVDLVSDDGSAVDEAVARLNSVDGVSAVPGRAAVEALVTTLQSTVRLLLAVFMVTTAVVAVMVSFLIASTTVAAESRELAVLQVLGSPRRALHRELAARLALAALVGALIGAVAAAVACRHLLGSVLAAAGLSSVQFDLPVLASAIVCLGAAALSAGAAQLASTRAPVLSSRAINDDV